jgi:uncharacterized membrane protein
MPQALVQRVATGGIHTQMRQQPGLAQAPHCQTHAQPLRQQHEPRAHQRAYLRNATHIAAQATEQMGEGETVSFYLIEQYWPRSCAHQAPGRAQSELGSHTKRQSEHRNQPSQLRLQQRPLKQHRPRRPSSTGHTAFGLQADSQHGDADYLLRLSGDADDLVARHHAQ